jgi:hypothetical protein
MLQTAGPVVWPALVFAAELSHSCPHHRAMGRADVKETPHREQINRQLRFGTCRSAERPNRFPQVGGRDRPVHPLTL